MEIVIGGCNNLNMKLKLKSILIMYFDNF